MENKQNKPIIYVKEEKTWMSNTINFFHPYRTIDFMTVSKKYWDDHHHYFDGGFTNELELVLKFSRKDAKDIFKKLNSIFDEEEENTWSWENPDKTLKDIFTIINTTWDLPVTFIIVTDDEFKWYFDEDEDYEDDDSYDEDDEDEEE